MVRKALFVVGALLVAGGLLLACSALPPLEGRSVSTAYADTADTRLGRAVSALAAAHPGLSGIHPLADSRDAFAARVLLARAAERSLDVQYYIWNGDLSGTLLFDALREAAERGVRVRLLLDDNNTSGLDPVLAALDAHRNIEVRLFNPYPMRVLRPLAYLTDPARLNRRMHNKSFTADGQATIVGGRNIGDEYFDATEGAVFVDLDVLAVGPVVRDVSADFDRYWASASAYPAGRLLAEAPPGALERLAADAARAAQDPDAAAYLEAVRSRPFVNELMEGWLPLEWAPVQLVSDDPAKALGRALPESSVPEKLARIVGRPGRSVDLVSAYFVPTEAGVAAFAAMAARGVSVRILTNSLEATDVAVVHAGYAKRRKSLLEAGVRLYEMRRLLARSQPARTLRGPGSSGEASLHAKTFAVDGERVFVGSFNFDPRSSVLNTEMGFVIQSAALARRIQAAFEEQIPSVAYEVRLSENGRLFWLDGREGQPVRHDTEPGTGLWLRAGLWLLSLLPIEGML